VPFKGLYQATKHAVMTISETLYLELAMRNSGRIGVSVLCPGFVNTRILDSARNRPADLAAPLGELSPAAQEWDSAFRTLVAAGMSPDKVAD
jgi:NAD(P)-dependent dehydrogenase (short-subunit alcohol dehydrogenase family)